ncbi:protein THEM6 isoform X1 [Lissotriton helveticus]
MEMDTAELTKWLSVGLGVTSCFFSFLDGWYWLRGPVASFTAGMKTSMRDVMALHTVKGRVMPTDVGCMFHMNNSRYQREADFARVCFFRCSGILKALRAEGASVVTGVCAIRYRRPMRLLEPFQLSTRLLCWDKHSFFLEQRFVSLKDGYVCALLISRQNVQHCSPEKALHHIFKQQVESPEFPEEVVHLISFNDASSRRLRAESATCEAKKSK